MGAVFLEQRTEVSNIITYVADPGVKLRNAERRDFDAAKIPTTHS